MMSMPTRFDQMLSVHAAVDGGILLPTARQPTPSAPSIQVITKRQTTGARWKGARWEEADHAPTER